MENLDLAALAVALLAVAEQVEDGKKQVIMLEDLKIFISKYMSIEKNEISMETSINKDLGLYGEEAVEFLDDFSKSFNVDIRQFDFDKYFRPEMDAITRFMRKKVGMEKEQLPLYISDLAEAIKKGVLN